uniref:Uncharacterized protein n=1 Tax=Anguilla anguilla TaxID=7936 RepID=A0A0E9XEE2_ANGAN
MSPLDVTNEYFLVYGVVNYSIILSCRHFMTHFYFNCLFSVIKKNWDRIWFPSNRRVKCCPRFGFCCWVQWVQGSPALSTLSDL